MNPYQRVGVTVVWNTRWLKTSLVRHWRNQRALKWIHHHCRQNRRCFQSSHRIGARIPCSKCLGISLRRMIERNIHYIWNNQQAALFRLCVVIYFLLYWYDWLNLKYFKIFTFNLFERYIYIYSYRGILLNVNTVLNHFSFSFCLRKWI